MVKYVSLFDTPGQYCIFSVEVHMLEDENTTGSPKSLAVLTQYTNVTDTSKPDPAGQQELRLAKLQSGGKN